MSDDDSDDITTVGGKKSNGHKMDCKCPICKNMMKKKGGADTPPDTPPSVSPSPDTPPVSPDTPPVSTPVSSSDSSSLIGEKNEGGGGKRITKKARKSHNKKGKSKKSRKSRKSRKTRK
jgi:hypothetical protein